MVKLFIEKNSLFYHKVKWVMTLISQYARVSYVHVDERLSADITIGSELTDDIKIDKDFFVKILNGHTYWQQILSTGPVYISKNGSDGIIETIFYLVNCLQEIKPKTEDLDHWGRFKYKASLQHHYGIIEENFVGKLIDRLIHKFPILNQHRGLPRYPSKYFITHDIDIINGGWKVEGYFALKSWNIPILIKVLKDKFWGKPFYNNIEEVLSLDDSYGVKACYYLLPKSGKDAQGIMNADYSIDDLRKMTEQVQDRGHDIGIHKSSFKSTFDEESKAFPTKVEHNRYHFLKFQTHDAWKEIESAGIRTDSSLGFAEHIGFRNSYGLPFTPFDMENDRPFSFFEIPLHVMDVTLFQYMGMGTEDAFSKFESFVLRNFDQCTISLLWHNNTLSNYSAPYSSFYNRILRWLGNQNLSVTQVNKILES
jgi:hypothetical protein